MPDAPSAAVVIPNWNGDRHLPDCLDSLASLDFPSERLEVIVVDNGSTDDSLELLRERFPWVKRVELGENLGFAEASNRGAAATTAECVAFLNNDMRVDRQWLTELLAQYDPSSGYVCVAGVMLDWEGDHVDFMDGWINFHGGADQDYRGVPLDEAMIEDGRDLAFACGGAMLVQQEAFLALGGFDPRYFAFLEDVDLGWRLWLAGYRVRLAGGARSFHRGHATGSSLPSHELFLLWERNTLLTLFKNVSDENLPGLLAAAALLLAERARLRSGSKRTTFDIGTGDAATQEPVNRIALAGLHAVGDLLADLDGVLADRRRVQELRKRDDESIFELFRRPFAPASRRASYLEASLKLRAVLGIDSLYTRQRVTGVLVIAPEKSRRLRAVAANAAIFAPVVLASDGPPERIPGVSVSAIRGDSHLLELLSESDCVVLGDLASVASLVVRESRGILAVDLADRPPRLDPELLRAADLFLCRSVGEREDFIHELEASGQTRSNGDLAERVVVLPDETDLQKAVLRTVLFEPWRWRDPGSSAASSEDFRLLLQTWREHYRRTPRTLRAVRAVWRRMPNPLQRVIFRVGRR